jgi:short-chain fatty acids transporter
MLTKLGQKFTDAFTKYMASVYLFALRLTLITGALAFFTSEAELFEDNVIIILKGWHSGFWSLLTFGMQIVLIIITAYCIGQSAPIKRVLTN